MLGFLRTRAVTGVEQSMTPNYRRTLAIERGDGRCAGWIAVAKSARRHALAVTVSASLAPRRARGALRGCGTRSTSAAIPSPSRRASVAWPGAHPGLRVPGTCDGFELAVRAVIGQQISVAGARTLLGRLVAAFGARMPTGCLRMD